MSESTPSDPGDENEPAPVPAGQPAGLSRAEVFSWLSGPRSAAEDAGTDLGYRGQRLGYPESGSGAVATFGRRLAALTIDWLACYLIAWAVVTRVSGGEAGLATIRPWNTTLFLLEVWLLTALAGGSFGQQILRIGVRRVDGTRLGPGRCLLRTVLIVLVIPAIIWDRDGRGLHDKAVGSVCVNR